MTVAFLWPSSGCGMIFLHMGTPGSKINRVLRPTLATLRLMNIESIEKFLNSSSDQDHNYVKISFKKREAIYGMFVKDKDFTHLRAKNFWRIVTRLHFDEFKRSGDMSLARIFNGAEFTRLTALEQMVE
jgi:hypothetical protein